MGDSRNPYILLGVPFGCSRDVAQAAFARQARGLRRQRDGAARLKDLTWALNQIQEVLGEPHLAIEIYRVPADPGTLEPDSPGVLNPGPEQLGRSHGPSASFVDDLVEHAAREAHVTLRGVVASFASLPSR